MVSRIVVVLHLLVLDTVSQLVVLVVPPVAEELSTDRHAAEVTAVLVTAVLTVVPVNFRIKSNHADIILLAFLLVVLTVLLYSGRRA